MPLTINELQKKRVQYIQQANPQVIQDSINQYLTLERNSKADVAAYGISRAYNVIASWTPLQNAVDAIPGYPVFLGMIPSLATFEQYKNQIHAVFSFNEWFELIETVTFHQYQQQKIKNHFMRMTDFQANGSIMAAVDTVFQFSIALLEAEANGKNIYFHCKAGRARSAMMLAVCIWHHEKYVKGNVNADYNKIVASLKMTRSQVDIGEEKHALAREIMRGIDEFYTAYPAIPDEQPEILQDVTNPKYVFSTVLQLPVLKAAVKAGQWIKNTSPSELDQGSLEKFINCIKDCKHDWLSVLANNVRPEGMDEQIFEDIQFFKRCYPDVACSMVFDLIKKEEVDIAPAFDYKGFYEQLQTAIEHYKGDKILRWFPGTVGGSRASTEVFLAEFVEAESNSYFMKKLESRNKAQQVFMGILIYRMESLQDLDAYKNLYNGSENYPNDKENHQRLVDVIEKFKPRQGENPPFANMGPLFQLFFERLMIGLDPRTGETISTGIRFNSPATDDEKDLKRIHYLFMNVSDLADYCFKSDQPIFPFAKPDIVKPLSKNLFAFFGVNSQEAIRLIDSRLGRELIREKIFFDVLKTTDLMSSAQKLDFLMVLAERGYLNKVNITYWQGLVTQENVMMDARFESCCNKLFTAIKDPDLKNDLYKAILSNMAEQVWITTEKSKILNQKRLNTAVCAIQNGADCSGLSSSGMCFLEYAILHHNDPEGVSVLLNKFELQHKDLTLSKDAVGRVEKAIYIHQSEKVALKNVLTVGNRSIGLLPVELNFLFEKANEFLSSISTTLIGSSNDILFASRISDLKKLSITDPCYVVSGLSYIMFDFFYSSMHANQANKSVYNSYLKQAMNTPLTIKINSEEQKSFFLETAQKALLKHIDEKFYSHNLHDMRSLFETWHQHLIYFGITVEDFIKNDAAKNRLKCIVINTINNVSTEDIYDEFYNVLKKFSELSWLKHFSENDRKEIVTAYLDKCEKCLKNETLTDNQICTLKDNLIKCGIATKTMTSTAGNAYNQSAATIKTSIQSNHRAGKQLPDQEMQALALTVTEKKKTEYTV